MRKILVHCLFLLLSFGVILGQQTATLPASTSGAKIFVKDFVFHSASLDRDMHYRLILPRDYHTGGKFPVLYLLHGLYGDYKNWDTKTALESYAKNMDLLIVMPDADDSWYTNSATAPADKFEDYIAKDLISEIDGKYRTIRERHARVIAGLSMGGYGAIKIAIKYPGLFAFSGSLSGALNAGQNLYALRPEFRDKLLKVFGPEGSHTRADNDVFKLLKVPHDTPYPYFYLACGTSDFFLNTNRAFAAELSSGNIPYEYHETAGGHAWEYWNGALEPMLAAVGRAIGPSQANQKR